ncbi:heparinase II/III domain-containing protein [Sinorhizobium meliloti]|uniref:heparinase II/III domain-containing protein n=1 Tax=Rhizobium meliloti TaxID=382 RepID=UPI000FDA8D7E|nr:heparinase II/III family protein [Sinorhizobium meliloti]RVQ20101.1 hypothetical protein CN096_07380 [Sinorhizobium meliloti]
MLAFKGCSGYLALPRRRRACPRSVLKVEAIFVILSNQTEPKAANLSSWHEKKFERLTEAQALSGRTIIASLTWEAPHFGSVSLSDGHWDHLDEKPRTLGWQIQQFAFLPDLIACDRYDGSLEGGGLALAMAKQWWAKFRDTPIGRTNMAWHDHATALRLSNLLLLRSHLGEQADPSLDEICTHHASLLKQDDFYERGNNHGFDQSIVLFEYSQEMSDSEAEQLARDRIGFEISVAFAPDGGHVENSTGYHNFGIDQLKSANEMALAYTGKEIEKTGLVARAEVVLAHMTRPDGKLPHIGDTIDFTVHRPKQPPSNDLVLPASGWAFFRSGRDAQALHGAFKSGFISSSHRHDDDLALSLFAFGEEWIVDGGLFAHQQKDPMRIYMRSANAHSLPYVFGARPSRDVESIGRGSRIVSSRSDEATFEVAGETEMWEGFRVKRTITFKRLDCTITIRDQIDPVSDFAQQLASAREAMGYAVYGTRFLVPENKKVLRASKGIQIKGERRELQIESRARCKIISGQSAPRPIGWRSTKLNKATPAFDISFLTMSQRMDETFILRWV